MDSYFSAQELGTFAGITVATNVIVQFTKDIFKKRCKDYVIRIYTFFVAFILSFVFIPHKNTVKDILLLLINSVLICMASFGNYEIFKDTYKKRSSVPK
ncbi:hypothetical protein [Caldicellulosiruptor morganii]|uniref:Holin n=1 Tax=Caldicellulosiruptor morganii TaxID=1387555 RepID=A0ABY7BL09_9FIRM|nr:hypothetical protein [Caldicellulosiruptor morganii]WAM32977.1 hypothetical protein OTK00_001433 [Caldicellulosiruptor morganii]